MLLIDGDIICYRSAAVTESEHVNLAKWQADETIKRIMMDLGDPEFKIFLSGEDNFRYDIYPAYKANRTHLPKPKHLEALREHLVMEWDATIVNGIEADDAMGIAQITANNASDQLHLNTTICSIDKDLLQVPGRHYNFVKREIMEVSPKTGLYNFWYQVLVGDATDNIKGCPKVGPVGAKRALGQCDSMFEASLAEYIHYYQNYEEALKLLKMNGQVLWIMRQEADIWEPPSLEVEPEFTSWLKPENSSSDSTTVQSDQSQHAGS